MRSIQTASPIRLCALSLLLLSAGCADERTKPAPGDGSAPAPIDDIEVLHATTTSMTIRWTATGDDSLSGRAAAYDIRYLRGSLHDGEYWEAATPADDPPTPRDAGTVEEFTITGLVERSRYSVAIKAIDEEGNSSPLSPLAFGHTAREDDAKWWDGFAEFPDGQGIGKAGRWRGEPTEGHVACMAVYDDRLIVAGSFNRAGDLVTENIAQWDGESWSPLGSGIPGRIAAMIEYAGDLIVGGTFSEAGGAPAQNIARWNGSGWTPIGDGLPGGVVALALHEGDLFAAGGFRCDDGTTGCFVREWNGAWTEVGGLVGLTRINALASFGGQLYAGGFAWVDDTEIFMTRWRPQDGWDVVLAGPSKPTWLSPGLHGMSVIGNRLIVYGVAVPGAGSLGAWDGAAWQRLGVPGYVDSEYGGGVSAVAGYASALAVGGSFAAYPGSERSNLVAWWDGSQWQPFGSGVRGFIREYGFGGVSAAAEYQGDLYVGGSFLYAGEKRSLNIARWSASVPPSEPHSADARQRSP